MEITIVHHNGSAKVSGVETFWQLDNAVDVIVRFYDGSTERYNSATVTSADPEELDTIETLKSLKNQFDVESDEYADVSQTIWYLDQ